MTYDPSIENTEYMLGTNEGDARLAINKYGIAHESGNDNDIKDPNALLHEVQFMRKDWNDAYATHFVGYMDGKAQIYRIGEPGYVSWGALSANPYAPFQIEFARVYQDNHEHFMEAYKLYVEAIRYYSRKFGIPLTLDSAGNGIKSHQWVTNNYGGDHVDPYPYFARMGISKNQFASDLVNGFSGNTAQTGSSTAPVKQRDVITIANGPATGVASWDNKGHMIIGSNSKFRNGTAWKSFGVFKLNGLPMYKVAPNEYVPRKYTDQVGIITINAISGVNAVDGNGKQIAGSYKTFTDWSQWKSPDTGIKVINGKLYFLVATNEYIDSFYTIGVGNK